MRAIITFAVLSPGSRAGDRDGNTSSCHKTPVGSGEVRRGKV